MNAAESIHEISGLPKKEKGKVVDFICHLDESVAEQTRFAAKGSFEKAAKKAFPKHSKLFEKLA